MSTKIHLTPPEKLFRQCLLDCRDSMQDTPGMKGLELRWTGGWVRDKLLGTSSNDIDVALSTMTGWQFGQALIEYMKSNQDKYEVEAKQQGFKAEIKNLHKIEANPEKSKHLETITTRMFGIEVDFVNLRKEIYDEVSRNPQMEFGTAEEDALRRDACVNALFYNLDKQEVEDFTGKGLDDMKAKYIRTPLAPYQTFKDDPLRVLRLIRFACRLGFTIDPEALKAMRDPSVHEALVHKISRERVGTEVFKIMNGPDPYAGLSLIYDQGLYGTVFGQGQVKEADCAIATRNLRRVLTDCSSICLILKPKDDIAVAWTLAVYVPYRDNITAGIAAARDQIKAPNVVLRILENAMRNRHMFQDIVNKTHKGDATRAEVGVTLRRAGASWRQHVLYALLCETVHDQFETVIEHYNSFAKFVQEQSLEDAANLRPIIDGNAIKRTLDIQKAGSWIKDALELVVEWQFANPNGTADGARDMIASRRQEFPVD